MVNEKEGEFKMAKPVDISPISVDISDIQIDNEESVINACLLVHKYPPVEMVEGLILVVDRDNYATPMLHVWNKIDDIHFDVTSEKNGLKMMK